LNNGRGLKFNRLFEQSEQALLIRSRKEHLLNTSRGPRRLPNSWVRVKQRELELVSTGSASEGPDFCFTFVPNQVAEETDLSMGW